MTTEPSIDPRKRFVPRFLPWIVALLMLAVYWVTLDRWLSVFNMDSVAKLSGWTWQAEIFNPLLFLVTYPLRWLPTAQIPVALDLLGAIFGALTLGLLARSVALLPQDRTEAQRLRETSDFSFLTVPTAWIPPVFAVLVCGLQFTFWENATNFTGEMVDVFVFAFAIWSLLEYRLDERDGRLFLAMFLFGADMADNTAAIGFLPLLLAALIWVRGLSFFNSGFLLRLILCGLAGTSLYLLLPTLAVLSGQLPGSFWWPALKICWATQWHVVRPFFTDTDFRHTLGLVSLTTLLPAVLVAFRWGAGFGDRSRLGMELTGFMVHVISGVVLFMCLWGAFDPPFSARHLLPNFACLPFYYLAALSVGYYSGYFLLISTAIVERTDVRPPSAFRRMMHPVAIAIVVAVAALTTMGLIVKNQPIIQSVNGGALKQYAHLMEASLPHTGGILLSDSETSAADSPRLLYMMTEALAQDGRAGEWVPVDTFALNAPNYHRYLHKKFPAKWPLVVDAKSTAGLDPRGLLGLMQLISKTNNIYYLHPSFGYYFEAFYPEPHGLIYKLKPLPDNTLRPPQPDSALISENEAFWAQADAEAFAPIIRVAAPINPYVRPHGAKEKIMARLHVKPESDYNTLLAGTYFSRSLNFWGVQLQRANDLTKAAPHFDTAEKLNPDNVIAGINLDFNHALQAGQQVPVDLSKTSPDQFGKYRSWGEIVTANGPFDEPSYCYADGETYLQSGYLHQALASFYRVRALEPGYLPALLSLAELYVFAHRADLALVALKEPLSEPAKFSLNDTNSTELNIIAAAAYIQETNLVRGVGLVEKEIANHPDDSDLLGTAAQLYLTQGLYTNALHVIKIRLQLSPDDPQWLYELGYAYMRLNQDEQAIEALSRVLTAQPQNQDALFNRALAYLNTGKLNAARSDYQELQKSSPKSFQVTYGLGEIAWRQHETNEAIQNYTLYLANAPTNTPEAKMIGQRLANLKGAAH